MKEARVTFSPHAKWRLDQRKISEGQVRTIIAGGTRTPEATAAGAARRWRHTGRMNGRNITVITVEDSEGLLVVTAY